MVSKGSRINRMHLDEVGPEKAGVGGSIPSLATMFPSTYQLRFRSFGSNWFQFS